MRKIKILIAAGAVVVLGAVIMGMCVERENTALIKIEGTIITPDRIVGQLEDARRDSAIKAVVLRVDSPGGAVGASQEIYDEVKKVNAEKPVVVSMGDVAASGGYYVSCGASKIFANAGTITGSIGVRMEHVNIKELLNWAKMSHETLKSGEFKDIGNIDRPMTKEEKAILEDVLKNMHAQFKAAVSESRNIPADKVEKIADGRVYTGEQAKELGLVDEIGGLVPATKAAAELAGIKGEPNVRKFKDERSWLLKFLLDDGAKSVIDFVSNIQARRFL